MLHCDVEVRDDVNNSPSGEKAKNAESPHFMILVNTVSSFVSNWAAINVVWKLNAILFWTIFRSFCCMNSDVPLGMLIWWFSIYSCRCDRRRSQSTLTLSWAFPLNNAGENSVAISAPLAALGDEVTPSEREAI